jgi:hypothetical protein
MGWTSERIAVAFCAQSDSVRHWRWIFGREGVAGLRARKAPGPESVKARGRGVPRGGCEYWGPQQLAPREFCATRVSSAAPVFVTGWKPRERERVFRQAALFAHCASLSVNAVHDPWSRGPRRHADTLARAMNLDMAAAGWSTTVDNYLGHVPKARIPEAVREAKGKQSVQLIDDDSPGVPRRGRRAGDPTASDPEEAQPHAVAAE